MLRSWVSFWCWIGFLTSLVSAQDSSTVKPQSNLRSHIRGMLYGTLIGDARGGPVEFVEADRSAPCLRRYICGSRVSDWRKQTSAVIRKRCD